MKSVPPSQDPKISLASSRRLFAELALGRQLTPADAQSVELGDAFNWFRVGISIGQGVSATSGDIHRLRQSITSKIS